MSIQTLGELIEALEDARDEMGEDVRVRVAFQPSWPLRAVVQYVTVPPDVGEDEDEDEMASKEPATLWLAVDQVSSSSENPYAPRFAWQQCETDTW
jgi:hypothetical protein